MYVAVFILNMFLPLLSYALWSLGLHPYDVIVTPILLVAVQVVGFRAAVGLTNHGAPLMAAMLDHMRHSTFCAACAAHYDIDTMPATCPECGEVLSKNRPIVRFFSRDSARWMSILSLRFEAWFLSHCTSAVWLGFGLASIGLGWGGFTQFLNDAGYGIPMSL